MNKIRSPLHLFPLAAEQNILCTFSSAHSLGTDGDNWKVVNIVAHRGIYSDASLARDENANKAYQEDMFVNIPNYIPLDDLYVDLGSLPRSPPQFYMDDVNFEDEHEFEDEDVEDEDEDEEDESDGEDEDVEDEDEEDGENEEDSYMDDEP
ncbi:hypothetical protein QQ045_024974 [Rhodiola kirilowii]